MTGGPQDDGTNRVTDREEADASEATEPDALLDRLRVIEDQPLEERAISYAQAHDALQARLGGS